MSTDVKVLISVAAGDVMSIDVGSVVGRYNDRLLGSLLSFFFLSK